MASPFDIAREWGDRLRPIVFAIPRPMLPAATVSFLHYAGVPTRFEISGHQQIRFDLLPTPANLADVWPKAMPDWSLPVGWARLWRIGTVTYTQANPWLCIEELTGRVMAVDVDLDDPLCLVNSSVESMVRCMRVLYDWASTTGGALAQAASLKFALTNDPALPPGEATHYWLPLVEEAVESGGDRLKVSFE